MLQRRFALAPMVLIVLIGPLSAAPPTIIAPGFFSALNEIRLPPTPIAPGMANVPFVTKLPHTNLAPAKLFPNLCVYRYRASTRSEICQAYIDQGLGFYYSYVWIEAARSFETALKYDPDCAFAWLGLSRSMEKWGKGNVNLAMEKARDLMPKASDREKLLIRSRLEQRGMVPGITPEDRVKRATATLDELLTLYDDDQEGWFARAQIAQGNGSVPFYKSLLRINPLHPGANHELVHFYENFRRPALGWPYADAYIQSSPGIPHAYHMQAHLATRLGKWSRTTDLSARAIELQREYHAYQNVQPKDDHQYSHHLEILTLSLTHDGRYQAARAIKAIASKEGYQHDMPWYRLHRLEGDWKEAFSIVEKLRKRDKAQASYLAALLWLDQDQPQNALPEIDTLRQAAQQRKNDKRLELRLWEVHGRYLCRTGAPDDGLKLLERTVQRTKDDFNHHSWGNGAYFMETWGDEALMAGNIAVAEEAYLEALAHDPGSVRAALGMQVLCERLGRTLEAERFGQTARRCWGKADAGRFETLREMLVKKSTKIQPATAAVGGN